MCLYLQNHSQKEGSACGSQSDDTLQPGLGDSYGEDKKQGHGGKDQGAQVSGRGPGLYSVGSRENEGGVRQSGSGDGGQ